MSGLDRYFLCFCLFVASSIHAFTISPSIFRVNHASFSYERASKIGQFSSKVAFSRTELSAPSATSTSLKVLEMKSGGHGENFKFLPIIKGSNEDHYPRIIKIAGVFPNLSPESLLAPISTPAPAPGQWTYDFSDPEGPQLGTVAVPGSPVITACVDPVVMIAKNKDIGLTVSVEVECLVVVDRADRKWSPNSFFVFRTPNNRLLIQWTDKVEKGFEILGKVVLVAVPWLPTMERKKSGWLEDDEE